MVVNRTIDEINKEIDDTKMALKNKTKELRDQKKQKEKEEKEAQKEKEKEEELKEELKSRVDYMADKTKVLPSYDKLEFWSDAAGTNYKNPKQTIGNYTLYLMDSVKYKGKLKYNEYLRRNEMNGREFNESDRNQMYADIEELFGQVNRPNADTALVNVFSNNTFNPLRDKLKSLKWDGVKRVETLFINTLQADDTPMVRELTRKWMIAAVKRTIQPGCKFDNMIVLQGPQGVGKTTVCERLSMGYFNTISLGEVGNKDLIDKLNKTWIAIIDEMDTFNKKEMSTIKTFLSQTGDTVRLSYRRDSETFDRHCIFIGSTNDDTFLRDNTSSVERRFWTIKIHKTTMDDKVARLMTPDYVEQLWAEAYNMYNENPDQYLDISQSIMDEFVREQDQFKIYNDDDFIDSVKDVLDGEYHIDANGEVTDIDQLDENYSATTPKYKINQIPSYILRQYLKEKYHTERSNKYIMQGLKDWEWKDARYENGMRCKSWVRKVKVSQSKDYNPYDAFNVR